MTVKTCELCEFWKRKPNTRCVSGKCKNEESEKFDKLTNPWDICEKYEEVETD